MTERPRRFGWTAAALLMLASVLLYQFSGPSTPRAPASTISRQSPFLLQRYGSPMPADFADASRIAGALAAAGYPDDARRLTEAWERPVLRAFLGEVKPARARTVEAAIAAEALETESIKDLRRRTLARVSLRFASFADAFSVSRNRTRMVLTNSLAAPVTQATFMVPLAPDRTEAFHCRPETPTPDEAAAIARAEALLRAAQAKPTSRKEIPPPEERERADAWRLLQRALEWQQGVPIAPGASAGVTCSDASEAARAVLDDGSRAWTPVAVQSTSLLVSGSLVRPDGASESREEGRAALEAASCAALLTCGEVARRQMLEIKRRNGQALFALIGILGPVLVWMAASGLRREPERPQLLATAATAVAAAAYGVQFLFTYWLLNPNIGGAAAFVLGLPVLLGMLQVAVSLVLVADFAWRRGQATRFRVALVAGSALMLSAAWILMFHCGYVEYLQGFSCR